ncbi:hypothetical protein A1O1_00579 [Capronia coronata CBS 617.96]|uniref:Mediator of RNA polymerase II transcription subunit 20 n=1 Tax=Capronia coronata CBS 617.96 TaxID=1182541 RepID=W9YRE8_9EURO|nr:uncharacterized protein A1O1_00579 [Capronia coronata CBS 617.96]EXJ95457.1 hypothetical protein A1O1_00579 [Capronia coronata CBS 617.96]
MPSTGLFFLPIAPNQPSPSALLVSHISRSFPAETLPTFHLDHRLFVDTSSLLPNSDTSLRRYTSILTLCHSPGTTYVGTTPPKEKPPAAASDPPATSPTSTLITIPSAHADPFTQLIGTKLQSHWAHRQSLVVDNGTALALQHEEWIVRIGDVRTPTGRSGQQTASNLRGMIVEVSFNDTTSVRPGRKDSADQQDTQHSGVGKDDETLIRGFLDSLFDGTGVQMASSRALFRNTRSTNPEDKDRSGVADWDLASLYMDMLRTPR